MQRPAADGRTIHHLKRGRKTLFHAGPAGLENAVAEFHCVAQNMLFHQVVSFL
jgi:hypothetical protein